MSQGRRDHNSSIATIAATDCERDLTENERDGRSSAFETYLAPYKPGVKLRALTRFTFFLRKPDLCATGRSSLRYSWKCVRRGGSIGKDSRKSSRVTRRLLRGFPSYWVVIGARLDRWRGDDNLIPRGSQTATRARLFHILTGSREARFQIREYTGVRRIYSPGIVFRAAESTRERSLIQFRNSSLS